MYSSIFGGIVTDPAAMFLPMDDHMVHRGQGVFDTAAIMDGSVILMQTISIDSNRHLSLKMLDQASFM